MFLLTYHAKPNKTFVDYNIIGGAWVNCWIESKTSEEAQKIARKEIEDYDWYVEKLDEIIIVDESFYSENDDKKEYFEQAIIDKIVLLFHSYPRNK